VVKHELGLTLRRSGRDGRRSDEWHPLL